MLVKKREKLPASRLRYNQSAPHEQEGLSMFGTLLIIILIATVIGASSGFLVLALRLGKNFEKMGGENAPPARTSQRRGGPHR
jgi:hypothetical protein